MATDNTLPRDTGPLAKEDLIDEDYELLANIERAIEGVLQDCDQPSRGVNHVQGWPWAVLDPGRTPRVMMIDGERGTGKTSLMLTLIDRWQKGQDGQGEVENEKHRWPNPNVARRVRVLHPLDFDPLPPSLPLLAWIVQAFKPVVDWTVGRYVEPKTRGLSQLDESHGATKSSLASRWQRLHDDAAIAWQPPESSEPFERGEDQLRRVRKWSQFEHEWRQFLDALMDRLAQVQTWQNSDEPGLLVLPIDDVDMQITRAPELIRAIRLLSHKRLVFLLTGHSALLDHVLQLDFDGQRFRLAQSAALCDALPQDHSHDLGVRLAEKVVRKPMRFELRRLDLPRALAWRGQALVQASGTAEAKNLAEHVQKPEFVDRWRGLLSITYRQLTDLERILASRRQEGRTTALVFDLFPFRDQGTMLGEPQEMAEVAKSAGLGGVIRSVADVTGRVSMFARPVTWQPLLIPLGGETSHQVVIATNLRQSLPDGAVTRPINRWLELWGRFGQDGSASQNVHIRWGGLMDGAVVQTISSQERRSLTWPSPWFAEWAGATSVQLRRWQEEYSGLWSLMDEELNGGIPSRYRAQARIEHDLAWESVLCGWLRHMQSPDEPGRSRKSRAAQAPAKGGKGVGSPRGGSKLGERLRETLGKGLSRSDKSPELSIDGTASALALAHPAYELPVYLQQVLVDTLWPVWSSPGLDPRKSEDESEWDRRWRIRGGVTGAAEDSTDLLEHVGLLNPSVTDMASKYGLDAVSARFLSSLTSQMYARRLLEVPLGARVLLDVIGSGAWFAQTLGSVGFMGHTQTPPLEFLSGSQERRNLAIMQLLPSVSSNSVGASIWNRTGYAAEAIGRLLVELGLQSDWATQVHEGVSTRGWTAAQFVTNVYGNLRTLTDGPDLVRRRSAGKTTSSEGMLSDAIWTDATGLLNIQHPSLTARLVDCGETPEEADGTRGLKLSFSKRWTFECELLRDCSPTERHARGAWVMLAADIRREQGTEDPASPITLDRNGEVWVRVNGKAWPAPPVRHFFEADMLRLRLSELGPPPETAVTSRAQDLWRLSSFIETVFLVTTSPWNWRVQRPLSGDIDRVWEVGAELSIWRAFRSPGTPGSDAQNRLRELAKWWTNIRPSLDSVLGSRIAARLKGVDGQVKSLLDGGP